MISRRAAAMESSGIRKVFDLAATVKKPLNLSIGQPDFDVPEPWKRVAVEAIRAGRNAYAPTAGIPELRQALAAHLQRRYGWKPEDLVVTAGVSGGLALAMLSTLDPGDEVLVPDPYFVSYKQLPLMCGARPVFYDVYPDWRIDAARVEKLVTPRTKVLLVNAPANPTGAVASSAELRALAEIAGRHDLLVLADEVYDDFCYDGAAPFDKPFDRLTVPSTVEGLKALSYVEGPPTFAKLWPKTLVLNGFSKSQAMTGWRVGWAAGPRELVAAMIKVQQFTYVTVPPAFQLAAAESLGAGGLPAAGHLDEYRAKRELACAALAGAFEFTRPGGAFYIFAKAPWGTGTEFAAAAVRERVLVIPGCVFSERDSHFRISFAAPDAVLEEACAILCKLARRGPAGPSTFFRSGP